MRKKYYLLIIISLIVLFLDQATKYYIVNTMDLYQSIEVIKGLFNITYARNYGAAFGLLSGSKSILVPLFFISVSFIAIGVILIIYKNTGEYELFTHLSLSLILSGAMGNLIDRVINQEVVDFLDFHWKGYHWPIFNVADSCITIGMIMLACTILMDAGTTQKKSDK